LAKRLIAILFGEVPIRNNHLRCLTRKMSFAVRNFTTFTATGSMDAFAPFFSPQIPFSLV